LGVFLAFASKSAKGTFWKNEGLSRLEGLGGN